MLCPLRSSFNDLLFRGLNRAFKSELCEPSVNSVKQEDREGLNGIFALEFNDSNNNDNKPQ